MDLAPKLISGEVTPQTAAFGVHLCVSYRPRPGISGWSRQREPTLSDLSPQPFMCKVETRQGRTIVRLSGDLDIVSADKCRERLEVVLHENDDDNVVDLRGLTFLDSMGLSTLLLAHRDGHHHGGRKVSFIQGNRTVHRVFQITETVSRLTWVDPESLDDSEPV